MGRPDLKPCPRQCTIWPNASYLPVIPLQCCGKHSLGGGGQTGILAVTFVLCIERKVNSNPSKGPWRTMNPNIKLSKPCLVLHLKM